MMIANHLPELNCTREDVEVLDVVSPGQELSRLYKRVLHVIGICEPLCVQGDDGGCHLGELEGVLDDGGAGCFEGRGDAEGGRWQVEEGGEREGEAGPGRREDQGDRGEN